MKGIKKTSILVVDDEKNICDIIVEAISSESFQVFATSDPTEALRHLRQNPVDLVLTDLVMGEYSGVQILETSLAYHSDAIVILMTAFPTVQTAISVLKKGAFDFLVKPFKLDLLRATVNRGLRHQHLLRDNLSLKGQVEFLKVANATPTGMKIDRFLKLVAASCKKELAAAAVGIIEVDPASRSVLQKIGDADDAQWIRDVLDESTVDQFIRGRSRKPVITSGRVDIDDRQTTKVVVSQPILIGRLGHLQSPTVPESEVIIFAGHPRSGQRH
jgi:DNA-binding response OmpR family regulator